MSAYERLVRPILFLADAGAAHRAAIAACCLASGSPTLLEAVRRRYEFADPRLQTTVAGIRFANPLGLAAGFDKNGHATTAMASLGFGHVEIGSVSAFPSRGNPRPRLFRLPRDGGVVVNYGLPNDGAPAVAARLRAAHLGVPLGINLVKTNDSARPATPEEVADDYARSVVAFCGIGDYLCLNLSCPNTLDGREFFGDVVRVDALLARLGQAGVTVPVFLKISPSRDDGYYRELLATVTRHSFVAGLQINLPSGKPVGLALCTRRSDVEQYPGSVAGRPVAPVIDDALRRIYHLMPPPRRLALVAAGGVFTAADAYRKVRLGASLVQLYTALIYRGPRVISDILRGLANLLTQDGYATVSDAVGRDA